MAHAPGRRGEERLGVLGLGWVVWAGEPVVGTQRRVVHATVVGRFHMAECATEQRLFRA